MIILPDGLTSANGLLTAYSTLPRSQWQGERLRILLLNLMPEKMITEADIVQMLEHSGYDIEIIPLRIAGQQYKTTPQEYVEAFYTDFQNLANDCFDGLIVTGAPIEHLPFEEVRYWKELCQIMDWAETHIRSSLYVCWGAQAALYHQWQVNKHALDAKMFGVFAYDWKEEVPLLNKVAQPFDMPTSRHTEVRRSNFPFADSLQIIAESEEAGIGIAIAHKGREVYITGHLEYMAQRLDDEYQRDLAKGRAIAPPLHYYNDSGQPRYQWRETALQIYHNWVKHYVVPRPR